jgi:hypothetical protein
MLRKYFFLTILVCFIPAIASADSAGPPPGPTDDCGCGGSGSYASDDTWHSEESDDTVIFTCYDLCAAADTCEVPCMTGDCLTFCEEHFTKGETDCVQHECQYGFASCICDLLQEEGDGEPGLDIIDGKTRPAIGRTIKNAGFSGKSGHKDSSRSATASSTYVALVLVMLGIGGSALAYSTRATGKHGRL